MLYIILDKIKAHREIKRTQSEKDKVHVKDCIKRIKTSKMDIFYPRKGDRIIEALFLGIYSHTFVSEFLCVFSQI